MELYIKFEAKIIVFQYLSSSGKYLRKKLLTLAQKQNRLVKRFEQEKIVVVLFQSIFEHASCNDLNSLLNIRLKTKANFNIYFTLLG